MLIQTTEPLYEDFTFDEEFDITLIKVKSISGDKVVGLSGKLELKAESSEKDVWPEGQPVWSSDKGGTFDPPKGPKTVWTPSKVSEAIDDVKIDTKCGGASESTPSESAHKVTVIEIQHQTKLEPNKNRTIIGVSEDVDLSVKPGGLSVNWELAGEGNDLGTLSKDSGSETTYTSAKENRTAKIVVKHKDKKIESLTIQTIEPTGVRMPEGMVDGYGSQQRKNFGIAATTLVLLLPDTVNFKNIKISEGVAEPEVSGYFDEEIFKKKNHEATTSLVEMEDYVNEENYKGTLKAGVDEVKFVFDKQPDMDTPFPLTDGTFVWKIPVCYHFDGKKKKFTEVEQKAEIVLNTSTTFKFTLSKGGYITSYIANLFTGESIWIPEE